MNQTTRLMSREIAVMHQQALSPRYQDRTLSKEYTSYHGDKRIYWSHFIRAHWPVQPTDSLVHRGKDKQLPINLQTVRTTLPGENESNQSQHILKTTTTKITVKNNSFIQKYWMSFYHNKTYIQFELFQTEEPVIIKYEAKCPFSNWK